MTPQQRSSIRTVARSALDVGVADLRRAPGSRHAIRLEVTAGDLDRDRIANADVEVLPTESIVIELTLDSSPGHIDATGTLATAWVGHCRRCLNEVGGTLDVDIDERFAVRPELHPDHDAFPIVDDHIDLAPMVAEALLISLPMLPLCREDCPGPDPEAHPIVVADTLEVPSDPRWAALDELRGGS